MADNKTAYKSAFKATSIFGGVQIFNIIIRIVRSKVVAVLLGPSGMGVFGLLHSSVEMISGLTNFGLGQSAVKNIAEANSAEDNIKLSGVVSVFRHLIKYTALFGALVCALFSPWWSQLTFGNKDYAFTFVILSVAVFVQQLTFGNTAVLQGLQKYKDLAKANVFGSLAGLVLTVPLYYFWGQRGIAPVLILTYAIAYFVAYIIVQKYPISKVSLQKTERNEIAKDIIKLGIIMSMSGLLSQLAAYFIRVFIRSEGSLDDVGFYNAGFAIVNTYVGLVFTAMATEYYPRLASTIHDLSLFKTTISQQTEIVLLLLIPMATAFIVFIRPIVVLLYSSKFIPVEGMIYWAIAAMIFKALAWSISFGLVTQGKMKQFSLCEFGSIMYGFVFNIIGYKLYGLNGLGISFLFMYIVYFIHIYFVFRKDFGSAYDKTVIQIGIIAVIMVVFSLVIKLLNNDVLKYLTGSIVLFAACLYSFKELDKRVELSKVLLKLKK